jgi:hypothetical protein
MALNTPKPAITVLRIVLLKSNDKAVFSPFHVKREKPSEIFLKRFSRFNSTGLQFTDKPTANVVPETAIIYKIITRFSTVERRAMERYLSFHRDNKGNVSYLFFSVRTFKHPYENRSPVKSESSFGRADAPAGAPLSGLAIR